MFIFVWLVWLLLSLFSGLSLGRFFMWPTYIIWCVCTWCKYVDQRWKYRHHCNYDDCFQIHIHTNTHIFSMYYSLIRMNIWKTLCNWHSPSLAHNQRTTESNNIHSLSHTWARPYMHTMYRVAQMSESDEWL